jgi:hypothetical protein
MKTALSVVLLTVLVTPSAAADVSGVWSLEMVFSPTSQSTGVCTFKQDGNKLTGTCGSESVPVTGEISDNKVTWQFEADQNGRTYTMTFSGVLDEAGTTIKGTCAVVEGPQCTFSAKKSKPQVLRG